MTIFAERKTSAWTYGLFAAAGYGSAAAERDAAQAPYTNCFFMVTLDMIRKPILADLEAFEEFVVRNFTADGELLSDMLRYALSARGKAIRPTVVLLSAGMNAPVRRESLGKRVYLAAQLVEMIHVASLIHDDVIDESDMRRGRPSVNARWQSHKAVILGDYILARNMGLGLASGQYDLITHVVDSMLALCEGEILQSERAEKGDMTRASYLDIIRKKTAILIGVSASAGALAVGASREKVSLMRRFGEALGMAFQIRDDILDYTPAAHTGKPGNNDLRERKVTLPLLTVLERVDAARRAELLDRLSRCDRDEAEVEYLQRTVGNEGGIAAATQIMQQYLTQAAALLAEYEPSEYWAALVNLCAYVAKRDR